MNREKIDDAKSAPKRNIFMKTSRRRIPAQRGAKAGPWQTPAVRVHATCLAREQRQKTGLSAKTATSLYRWAKERGTVAHWYKTRGV